MEKAPTIDELERRFALPRIAHVVAGNGGLPKVRITTPQAEAEMYLHGAQVTSWRPAGREEAIFLSEHSHWQEGDAIRGGIPICFPWFRAKADDPKAPTHGFVRTTAWRLDSVTQAGRGVTVSMSTESNASTKRWWSADFNLVHRVTVGDELKLELVVTNTGATSLRFEEALHTYYKVGFVGTVRLRGLEGVTYLDNTDSNRQKTQLGDLIMAKQTDYAYVNSPLALEVLDPLLNRRIRITKENSLTTVVWNPWRDGAKFLPDLGDDEWQHMACAEASNVLGFAVNLVPGGQHTMTATMRVDDL